MWFLGGCAASGCERQADTLCFECDRPYCRDHLGKVRILAAVCEGSYAVCGPCCLGYLRQAELRRLIAVELPSARFGA